MGSGIKKQSSLAGQILNISNLKNRKSRRRELFIFWKFGLKLGKKNTKLT
jgi:hypothetical protein